MRKGEIVCTIPTAGATKKQLAGLMVEGRVLIRVENPPQTPGKELLQVEQLSLSDQRGAQKLRDLSFSIKAGEIYGIAGVEGNGQSELLQALAGMFQGQKGLSGSITLEGRSLLELSPREIIDSGVGTVPEKPSHRGCYHLFQRHRKPHFRTASGKNSP